MTKACAHARSIAALGIVLAGVSLLCCPDALALDPTLDVSQYAHTSWKVRDGFTKGAIFAIAQTPDGYLWLGTESGLVRFDGVRPVPWQPPAGQQLPSNAVDWHAEGARQLEGRQVQRISRPWGLSHNSTDRRSRRNGSSFTGKSLPNSQAMLLMIL